MKKNQNENIVLLGTLIALEISKNKSPQEIHEIRSLISQILCTLSTLCC